MILPSRRRSLLPPMAEKNAHCSYCGQAFVAGAKYPRACASCAKGTYQNPLPVVEEAVELAFPLHTRVLRDFFARAAR